MTAGEPRGDGVQKDGGHKHGHDRFCWLSRKCQDKWFCIRCSKARETEDIPLVKLTPMLVKMDHHDLPNRVTTSFTSVRTDADRIQRREDLAAHII